MKSRANDDRLTVDLTSPLPSVTYHSLLMRAQFVTHLELIPRFLYGFLGIHALLIGLLLFSWVRNGFIINPETGNIPPLVLISFVSMVLTAFTPLALGAWRFRRASAKRIAETEAAVRGDAGVKRKFDRAVRSDGGIRDIDCEMLIPLAKLAAYARAEPREYRLIE